MKLPPHTKNPNGTLHSQRVEVLRRRLNRVLKQIEVPASNVQGMTSAGIFARRAEKIAKAEGMKFYRIRKAGETIKSITAFARGRAGMYGWALDVIEVTCHAFEMEFQAAKIEQTVTKTVLEELKPENTAQSMNTRVVEDEPRDEPDDIQALRQIVAALDPLKVEQRNAVVNYVMDRYAVVR